MIDFVSLQKVLEIAFTEMLSFMLALWLGIWVINILGRFIYDKLNNNYDE